MKGILRSKMFWTNVAAVVAFVVQAKTGFVVPVEVQASAVAALNIALRSITKDEVTWRKF